MAINDFFKTHAKDLAPGDQLIVDGSSSETGCVEIHEVFASSGVGIYKEVDTDNDGSFSLSILIESQTDSFHSQGNQVEVSGENSVRLRLVNTSNASADYVLNGIEVNN